MDYFSDNGKFGTGIIYKLPLYLTVLFPFLLLIGSAVADTAMSMIAVLFILRSFLEKDWGWTRELWVRCLALLWGYMIIRGVFAENPQEALRRSLPFVRYFIFASAIACWTLQDAPIRNYFFNVLAAFVLFLAADGMLQWFLGKDILWHPILNYDGHFRLTGPFRSEILGIMLAWLSFPVCMRFIMNEEGKLKVGYSTLIIVFIVGVIGLSGERMALLLTLCGWGAAMCIMPVRRVYLLAFFATVLALISLLAFLSPDFFDRQVFSTLSTLQHWDESPYGKLLNSDLHVAAVNPVFGVGTNHFRIACKEMYSDPSVCNIHPHNIYMEWLIEQGIIGFSLFIAFIAAIFVKCFKNWHAVHNNPVFVGLFIAIMMRLWPFSSSTGFFSRWGAPPFWLILGALLAYLIKVEPKRSL